MKLPSFIYKHLKHHNTSLGNNPAFPPDNEFSFDYKLLKTRFNDITDKLEKSEYNKLNSDELKNKLSELITLCQKKEEPIKNSLIDICVNNINSMFNVPKDSIDLNCFLVKNIKPQHSIRILPESPSDFNSIVEMENFNKAVLKRRFINSLIQGGSYCLSNTKAYLKEIYELNPELPLLYDKIRLINDVLLFQYDEKISDKNPMQGAYVEVNLGNDKEKVKINAQGLIFPLLFTETIRGFLELFASHGLPANNRAAVKIIKQADFLMAEPWDLRLGVGLWNIISEDVENNILPYFFMNLCKLKNNLFNTKIREILAKTKSGKNFKDKLIKKSKHQADLSDLEKDIINKNQDKSLITDEYMTCEDIDSQTVDDDLMNLLTTCDTSDIDFEPEQINNKQFQLFVIVKNVKIPNGIIDFKAEPRNVIGDELYQLHLFIDTNFQHKKIGFKIFKRFIELYGNAYCGYGRLLNKDFIMKIFSKLSLEPNIEVKTIYVAPSCPIGICAKLI